MKSVLSKKCCEKKEKPFPKLMVHQNTGRVLLFSNKAEGTCVYKGSGIFRLGEHREHWSFREYSDYEGDVCLTNSEE